MNRLYNYLDQNIKIQKDSCHHILDIFDIEIICVNFKSLLYGDGGFFRIASVVVSHRQSGM